MRTIAETMLLASALALTSCSNDKPDEVGPADPCWPTTPVAKYPLVAKKMSVDMTRKFQTMEGFAASDCWLPNQIGQYWTDNREDIARLLFSQEKSRSGKPEGIGLSMWRVNLGAGTAEQGTESNMTANNRAESYLRANGEYTWDHCEGQRFFMESAKEMGCENFVFFSNSPLVQYTRNGKGYSDSGASGNLKSAHYSDFANYMAEVASHFAEGGYHVSHISPVNEPQYDWGGPGDGGQAAQEGSGWQNSEIAKLTRELDRALSERGLATKILIPEAASWDYLTAGYSGRDNCIYAFYDPASTSYVGDISRLDNTICGHSYWTEGSWDGMREKRAKLAQAAEKYGLKVYQTEWSMLGDAPAELKGGYDNCSEFDIAQYMSRIIHNDITVGGCSSWSYWTAMSVERYGQKNRFELIKTTPKGGEYSDNFTCGGIWHTTPNLWVLGNYSLFVRPGFQRVALDFTDEKELFASAYAAPDGKQLVIVLTNYSKIAGVALEMSAPPGTREIQTYTTSETKKLEPGWFAADATVFVEPASVTTIVYRME